MVIRLDDSSDDKEPYSSSDDNDGDSGTVPGICFIHFMVVCIKS